MDNLPLVYEKLYFCVKSQVENYSCLGTKVSHIICLCDKPRCLRSVPRSISKVIFNSKKKPINPLLWISSFADIHCILTEGLAQGGVWMISDSKSIAKLVIASFLISTKKISSKEAISLLKIVRKSPLLEELAIQLHLWECMSGIRNDKFEPYKQYKDVVRKQSLPSPLGSRVRPKTKAVLEQNVAEAKLLYEGTFIING